MQHMVNKANTRWVAAILISGHLAHAGHVAWSRGHLAHVGLQGTDRVSRLTQGN